MKGRIKEDDAGVPAPDGPFAYYTLRDRRPAPVILPQAARRRRGARAVDGNQMAKPHAYFRIASVAHSSDHSLIAYAVDTKGSEFYTVNVIETDSGAVVDSRIADNNGSL